MNQITQMDPLTYNNCVLTHNIAILSSIPFHQLIVERDKIKADFDNLKKEKELEVSNLQRKLSEYEHLKKDNKNKSCCTGNDKTNTNINTNTRDNTKNYNYPCRFQTIYHPPNTKSWTPEKISLTISSIKSIDDIIKLKPHWFEIRHNPTLQRLHYLITPLTKLKNMVGLEDIKKDIFKKIVYWIQNDYNNEYLHTIISGPPGVGKTEFAKIYADIFVRLGILKTDKFTEIKRDDLVGEYLGQTSPKTRQLLESAMGGVLFLDEAYSLGNQEKRDSFSKEAIDMLNQYLSERKGEFMFIIAGYEEDLNSCLFSYNKGMRRRFHSHYKIKGYESKELKDIFIRKLGQTLYSTDISEQNLLRFFADNKAQFPYFGGDIEKLLNEIKQCQSLRSFNSNSKDKKIILNDMTQALKNMEDKDNSNSPPWGMYV